MIDKTSTITSMDRIAINLRLSAELRDALQALAKREGIPVTKLIMVALAKQYPELNDIILKH